MTLPQSHAIPIDRKKLIQSYGFVEQLTANENFLQESLALAKGISGAQIAYISLLDDDYQYILSQKGGKLETINVEDSICQFTINSTDFLVIEDTRNHELIRCLPQVEKEDGILFYAGCPLLNNENVNVGALCVMDTEPRSMSQMQKETLRILAKQIMTTLDNQRSMIKLIKTINSNFRPASCADFNCLQGELIHLQKEVLAQNNIMKKQKVALENTNEELSNFASMVAHDVRAPLRSISNFIQLHERDLDNSSIAYDKEYLDFIKLAATNLDQLTVDLLEYARSGNDSMEDEKLELNQLLQEVSINLSGTIEMTQSEIVLPKDTFHLYGKRSQLIQLFQNLIANAIKYQDGEVRPRIEIRVKGISDKLRISVVDNGIGISEDNLEKIFEPFKRLHTSDEYQGSGIGLATCKKIIDKLDSKFLVDSTLGKGSTFTFDLPRFSESLS